MRICQQTDLPVVKLFLLSGNHLLIRILPHLYNDVCCDPIHGNLRDLLMRLPDCELPEKNAILHLCRLIASRKPQVSNKTFIFRARRVQTTFLHYSHLHTLIVCLSHHDYSIIHFHEMAIASYSYTPIGQPCPSWALGTTRPLCRKVTAFLLSCKDYTDWHNLCQFMRAMPGAEAIHIPAVIASRVCLHILGSSGHLRRRRDHHTRSARQTHTSHSPDGRKPAVVHRSCGRHSRMRCPEVPGMAFFVKGFPVVFLCLEN